MSALLSCPRCSQVLPATAQFCRRCGTIIRRQSPPAKAVVAKRGPVVSAALSALLLTAILMVAFVVFSARKTPNVAPPAPVYNVPSVQRIYPLRGVPAYTNYPPMVITPQYPRHDREDRARHDYGTDPR